ncbi:MAG TPA: type II toxin-antitoxin system VapC family toxin [Ensifer sp.]|nr:type II toxin-antitoxin system VapC family toxin [Ensifer sp.]
MRVLLDTNVLSEARRSQPDIHVLQWLHELDEDRTFISVISIAEIKRGLALLAPGRRREALSYWLANDLPQRFERRVLPVDETVALAWGDLLARAQRAGRILPVMDGFLAATAVTHDLVLATRNIKDFDSLGIKLINPWLS